MISKASGRRQHDYHRVGFTLSLLERQVRILSEPTFRIIAIYCLIQVSLAVVILKRDSEKMSQVNTVDMHQQQGISVYVTIKAGQQGGECTFLPIDPFP